MSRTYVTVLRREGSDSLAWPDEPMRAVMKAMSATVGLTFAVPGYGGRLALNALSPGTRQATALPWHSEGQSYSSRHSFHNGSHWLIWPGQRVRALTTQDGNVSARHDSAQAARRPLRARRGRRAGRDGRGLPGPRPPPRPHRRGEDAARGPGQGPDLPGQVPARGTVRGLAQSPVDRRGLRHRR